MKKILLIAQREFISRVRKRSFWIMSFLGPVFFAVILIVPGWLGIKSEEEKKIKTIEVLDQTGRLQYKLPEGPEYRFAYFNGDLPGRMKLFLQSEHEALLIIPSGKQTDSIQATLYFRNQISPEIHFYLEQFLNQE